MTAPHPTIADLARLEPIKTWSLIVTLFGDLEADALTGTQLRVLLAHVGIKPEAIRVALHRLKKEGWITSDKQGREATYALSAHGRAETAAAYRDVYRQSPKHPNGWRLLVHPGAEQGLPVAKDVVLQPCEQPVPEGALEVQPQYPLPEWLIARLVSSEQRQTAADLVRVVTAPPSGSALDRAALRLLVLHYWRRMALRSGTWALIALEPEGVLAHCHASVTAYLANSQRIAAPALVGETSASIA